MTYKPDKAEKELILVCKGHFPKEYPSRGSWDLNLEPFWLKHWGWDPVEFRADYLRGMFNYMLKTFLNAAKPRKDNWYLTQLMDAVLYRDFLNPEEEPVLRGINRLASMMRDLQVREGDDIYIDLD